MRASTLLQYIIKPVLKILQLESPAAEQLLLGTVAQESRGGDFLKQVHGPALGMYQMEPATYRYLWSSYLPEQPRFYPLIRDFILTKDVYMVDVPATEMIGNLYLATAVARINYWRQPEALPAATDVGGLADYYKKYWNTAAGAATREEFRRHYKVYIDAG